MLTFTDEEVTQMDREISAEVSDQKLAKDATIEWGAADTNFDATSKDGKEIPKRDPSKYTHKPTNVDGSKNGKPVVSSFDPENEESLNSINSLFDELDHIGTEEELNE